MVALIAQPQPRIERDLLVAAAAGVDLVGESAHALLQFADDEAVYVLGVCVLTFEERGRGGVFKDGFERLDDFRALRRCQNTGAGERTREGLRSTYVRGDQALIEVERVRETLEDFRRTGFESPAPEFHFVAVCFFWSART